MKAVVRTRYGPPGVLRLMDVGMLSMVTAAQGRRNYVIVTGRSRECRDRQHDVRET
jgi:hypothetical protein